jgi:hypothetical protein
MSYLTMIGKVARLHICSMNGAAGQWGIEQSSEALRMIDEIGLHLDCVGKLLTTATEINVTAWRG